MTKPAQHAMMAAALLVGFLAATAQCRPEAGRTRSHYSGSAGGGGTDTTTEISVRAPPHVSRNSTAMEEGKLYIKFCIHRECKLDDKLYEECGCCALLFPYPKCFKSQEECQAQCPACHPNCPLPPPSSPSPPPPPPSLPPPPTDNIFAPPPPAMP